ncbi:TonB-dependent receptor plug domain-containing protein, partial [Bacteroides intestinalis]
MKYIQAKFILCAMLAVSPMFVSAQATDWNETDSLANEKDPMVQVAFRKVAQKDLLGGVSVVNVEELTKKNYNTYSLDNMQGYVGGWNGNSLWGMDGDNAGYLVLVDGVPRDANNVMPSEIAQISFLKGAQAVVLYGSKAAKGAVVITTKRGNVEGLNVSVRANTGFHVAKAFPEYLGSAEYMTLYNEALLNDDPTAKLRYTAEDIYNHGSGLNPYRYTNINYYSSDYVKKAYNRSEVTAEITGGGKRARFYSNVSYYRNGDFLDFGEAKNNMTDRFNVRGNVDVNINSFINAYINANATFYNSKTAKGDYWNIASTARPNFPEYAAPLIPLDMIDPNATAAWELLSTTSNIIDGKYFLAGTQANPTNAFADSYAAGSSKWTSRQFQFDAGVNVDLNQVLKGLSFNAMFAVDYATSYSTSFDNKYAVFVPTWANYGGKDVIVALSKEGNDEKPGTQNVGGSADKQTIAFSGQFNYQNTFNKYHNVSAMLIANGYQQTVSA